jgi:hypothetical protein
VTDPVFSAAELLDVVFGHWTRLGPASLLQIRALTDAGILDRLRPGGIPQAEALEWVGDALDVLGGAGTRDTITFDDEHGWLVAPARIIGGARG